MVRDVRSGAQSVVIMRDKQTVCLGKQLSYTYSGDLHHMRVCVWGGLHKELYPDVGKAAVSHECTLTQQVPIVFPNGKVIPILEFDQAKLAQ